MTVGTDEMEITAATPEEFSDEDRAIFGKLVEKGGEVGGNALAANIKNAKALVLGRFAGEVLGVAALKNPQVSYRKRIAISAGVDIAEENFPYEIGYVFLAREMQGRKLSHRLVAEALKHASGAGIFATTRTDNAPMLATLVKAGFKPTGEDYRGRGTRIIRLLVRPAIQPAG